MPKKKKIPHRMCVGCRQMKPKKELLRVVRTPDEKIELDPTGKRSGRGAYICPDIECLNNALRGKRLDKALQRTLSPEIIDNLKKELE
jgi:hypothetical protein